MAKLPSSNISNYDVATALGAGTLDVGSLCTHNNVNKWSRHKPLSLMVAHDTPIELSDSDFANYVEGVYSKPYGLFPTPVIIAKYDIGSIDFTKDESEVKEQTLWEYSQPKVLNDRVVNGENQEIYARLSDFCGYDHYAKSPISVEWLTKNEDGVKGVYARVTLNTNSDATYGGVLMSDFLAANSNTGGYFVAMLCIANEYINVPELSTDLYRYALGYKNGMSVALSSSGTTSAIIGVHNGMLSPLSGRTYNFIVVVNNVASPEYAISDGWTEWNVLHYYPYISNYSSIQNSIIIENAIKRVSLNDITGTTLFLTDSFENVYSEAYNLVNAEVGNVISFADNASGGYSASVKVTEEITSKKRVLAIRGADYGSLNDVDSYFNYIAMLGGSDRTGVKPIVADLPMLDSTDKASFFIKYDSRSSVSIIYQRTTIDGRVTTTTLTPQENVTFDCVTNAIKGFIISNRLDIKGNVTGLKIVVFYDSYANMTPSSFNKEEFIITGSSGSPYLSSTNGSDGQIDNYGSFRIGLPSVLSSLYTRHTLGGNIKVDYGIYDADNTNLGHYFNRVDNLNK